jgi:hypothetical protein
MDSPYNPAFRSAQAQIIHQNHQVKFRERERKKKGTGKAMLQSSSLWERYTRLRYSIQYIRVVNRKKEKEKKRKRRKSEFTFEGGDNDQRFPFAGVGLGLLIPPSGTKERKVPPL